MRVRIGFAPGAFVSGVLRSNSMPSGNMNAEETVYEYDGKTLCGLTVALTAWAENTDERPTRYVATFKELVRLIEIAESWPDEAPTEETEGK